MISFTLIIDPRHKCGNRSEDNIYIIHVRERGVVGQMVVYVYMYVRMYICMYVCI